MVTRETDNTGEPHISTGRMHQETVLLLRSLVLLDKAQQLPASTCTSCRQIDRTGAFHLHIMCKNVPGWLGGLGVERSTLQHGVHVRRRCVDRVVCLGDEDPDAVAQLDVVVVDVAYEHAELAVRDGLLLQPVTCDNERRHRQCHEASFYVESSW